MDGMVGEEWVEAGWCWGRNRWGKGQRWARSGWGEGQKLARSGLADGHGLIYRTMGRVLDGLRECGGAGMGECR